jgi:hypothetical protein
LDTKESHNTIINKILNTLRQHNFYGERAECSYYSKEIEFLGHFISPNRIKEAKRNILQHETFLKASKYPKLKSILGLIYLITKFTPFLTKLTPFFNNVTKKDNKNLSEVRK